MALSFILHFLKFCLYMEYGKIISVTGLVGLYELVGSKKDGAIIRSLEDKSTKFVASRIHNFSHLESIEVYTERDNVNLADVFVAMQGSSEPLPTEKDAAAVKAYFQKVYPEMDFERVYASDMKKMVKWFSILKSNNVEIKLSEVEDQNENENVEDAAVEHQPAPEPAAAAQPEGAPKEEAPKKAKRSKKKDASEDVKEHLVPPSQE